MRDLVVGQSRSSLSDETAYRFKHVLIREVAYSGLSKSARAEYHGRFAEWLSERAGDELLEIRAYHLDHAASLLAELDGAPPEELRLEAAETLHEAGRRALAREANEVAREMFLRAVELEPTLDRRYLAARAAHRLDDFPTVAREMQAVREEAHQAGDRRLEGRAATALADVTLMRDADCPSAMELANQALELIDASDPRGALRSAATTRHGWLVGGPVDRIRELHARSTRHRAGDRPEGAREHRARGAREHPQSQVRAGAGQRHPRTSPRAGRREWLDREPRLGPPELGSREHALRISSTRLEEAITEAVRLFREAGAVWAVARALDTAGWIARGRGDLDEAEKRFRESIRLLKPLGDRATLCESQRSLAQVLLERGKIDEAERYALDARETVGAQDITSLSTTAFALGLVRAAQGRDEEAEELLRSALATAEQTDFREIHLNALGHLADFLRERGRDEEADPLEARRDELRAASRSAAPIA